MISQVFSTKFQQIYFHFRFLWLRRLRTLWPISQMCDMPHLWFQLTKKRTKWFHLTWFNFNEFFFKISLVAHLYYTLFIILCLLFSPAFIWQNFFVKWKQVKIAKGDVTNSFKFFLEDLKHFLFPVVAFKIRQIVAGIRMTIQFHEFFKSNFCQFFVICPINARASLWDVN